MKSWILPLLALVAAVVLAVVILTRKPPEPQSATSSVADTVLVYFEPDTVTHYVYLPAETVYVEVDRRNGPPYFGVTVGQRVPR